MKFGENWKKLFKSEGKIVFADLTDNYRIRPEPESFLKVIDELAYGFNT